MEILKVQDVSKSYGEGEARIDALKHVSFSLGKGEFAAVVGESGSGKSTLLNCIGALDSPTSGSILVDGQDLFSMREEERTIFRRRNIGFIFQSFQLVSELDVEQNIIFPLLLDYRQPDPAAVEEMLDLLGLSERRHHLPSQLSGGQQQRVAIGRALITKPKLILADEPTQSRQPEQPGRHRPAHTGVSPFPAGDPDDHAQQEPNIIRRPGAPGVRRRPHGLGRDAG